MDERIFENENIGEKALLCAAARRARAMAYVPYSGFRVGAALLGESGKVYRGCNIENAAYSPTNCAERTAFFKAVSEGERQFKAIAIAGGSGEEPEEICPPCGVCLQVMTEFCDPDDFTVYLVKNGEESVTLKLRDLLPYGFSKDNLA